MSDREYDVVRTLHVDGEEEGTTSSALHATSPPSLPRDQFNHTCTDNLPLLHHPHPNFFIHLLLPTVYTHTSIAVSVIAFLHAL
jgi:hypothetical protein